MTCWVLKEYPGWLQAVQDKTLMVHSREPESNGLLQQIYAFTKDKSILVFETVQSEIIEHFLAVLNEFELLVFQQLTGEHIMAVDEKD